MRVRFLTILMLLAMLSMTAIAQDDMSDGILTKIGTYDSGIGEGGSEIAAYEPTTQQVFVTNGEEDTIDVIDISDPTTPTLVSQISLEEIGSAPNSVAATDGLVAVAVEASQDFAPGTLAFIDPATLEVVNTVEAGVLPDMVAFSPDGNYVLSANEGEPSEDYFTDPEGSVTVVDLTGGVENATATPVTFEAFNDAIPEGVRVFGPGATLAQDLEPEYITISADSSTAFVIAQENNAMIVIDIVAGEVTSINGLGTKDYSVEANAIDPSNEDDGINIRTVPVQSYYMPDAIAAFEINGETFVATANEGDARDYEGFSEEARIADVTLDPEAFPNAEELQQESNLGRLLITTTAGDTDGDGDFDELYGYGARSFTIWDADFNVVFDSANDFETITSEMVPEIFNSNGLPDTFDQRSDDKGPEPEAITTGTVGETTYAFIGMERVGGIFIYDVTDPANAIFVSYFNDVNLDGSIEDGTAGDISPEGLLFIPAEDSPTGNPLLVGAYEISGTTTIYEVGGGM